MGEGYSGECGRSVPEAEGEGDGGAEECGRSVRNRVRDRVRVRVRDRVRVRERDRVRVRERIPTHANLVVSL